MKKFLSVIFIIIVCLALFACKSSSSTSSSKSSSLDDFDSSSYSSSSSSSSLYDDDWDSSSSSLYDDDDDDDWYSSSSSSFYDDFVSYGDIELSNIRVYHERKYAYITGTITNTGESEIRYIRVKAACKNRQGDVIDTTWTYAVDSAGLEPDESNTFEMMVRDEDYKISDADLSILDD